MDLDVEDDQYLVINLVQIVLILVTPHTTHPIRKVLNRKSHMEMTNCLMLSVECMIQKENHMEAMKLDF